MPNRVLREGLIDSEKIDQLSPEAERFFVRLMLKADDFGRYHGNAQLLKSNLFPLKESIPTTSIEGWITECITQGILRTYSAAGKRYLLVPKFNQRHRSHVSKFPAPGDDLASGNGPAGVRCMADLGPATGGQVSDIGPPPVGHPRTETETRTETKSKTRAVAVHARASFASSVELPPGFPSSEAEALQQAQAAGMSVPEAVVRAEWLKAAAVGGCTSSGQPIRSWPRHLAWAAGARADRESRQGQSPSQRLARHEARSGVVPRQTNSKREAAL